MKYTHRVAVGAYLFDRKGRLLLLHRCNPPLVWAPPGGRLRVDEDPIEGLKREVREETALEIDVIGVAGTWFGRLIEGEAPLLAIDFVTSIESGKVQLSAEHDAHTWASAEEIAKQVWPTVDENGKGYEVRDFLKALVLYFQTSPYAAGSDPYPPNGR